MTTVISVENLSKAYQLGVIGTGTFRGDLQRWWAKVRGRPDPLLKVGETDHGNRTGEMIWALKDVSFDVRQGEAIGIIGRNGAGKSTLLKILSRVTAPTSGLVKVKGRIASLLEVGTGFHPELTGRENIFLNGAILGMSRDEVRRKFDQIVDFSGVEQFIDTPVKRYSSGMYVRLAFAVAAHLDPEILVVDEVLAVGDAEFQKKCLGKMSDVTHEGRTVLFVSHNMQAIRQLCKETMWIDRGQIKEQSSTPEVVDKYLRLSHIIVSERRIEEVVNALPPDPAFRLRDIRLHQGAHPVSHTILNGQPLEIEFDYEVLQKTTGLRVFFDLLDEEFTLIFRSFHDEHADGIPTMLPGSYTSRVTIPENILASKEYYINVNAGIYNERMVLPRDGILIPVSVAHSGEYNKAYASDVIRGLIAPSLEWKTVKRNQSSQIPSR